MLRFRLRSPATEGTSASEGLRSLYRAELPVLGCDALDHVIDWGNEEERELIWDFVSMMLFNHMGSAGFDFDETDAEHMQGDSRDEVNYLIDRISKRDRKR